LFSKAHIRQLLDTTAMLYDNGDKVLLKEANMTITVTKNIENENEAQRLGRMIKYLRLLTEMNREDFANYLHIPLGTVRDWEQGKRKMPEYVYELIEYKVNMELLSKYGE